MTFQFLFRLTEHVHAAIHLSNNKKTTFNTTINSLTFASQNWYPKKKEIAFVNPYLGVSMLMDCVYILFLMLVLASTPTCRRLANVLLRINCIDAYARVY